MDVLEAMAAGRGITIVPQNAELTTLTQQGLVATAAELEAFAEVI